MAGLGGAIASLALGASGWTAFGVYTLAGMAGIILTAVCQVADNLLFARGRAEVEAGPARTVPAATDTGRPDDAPFTILTVDDDPFIRELVETIGANAGDVEIVTASSGAAALALLGNAGRTFDYLLLDISMPQMSGIELCRQVRRLPRYRDVPIVMLTALRDMDHIAEAFRAGATDYATKPFDIETLRRRFLAANEMFRLKSRSPESATAGIADAQATSTLEMEALTSYLALLSDKEAGDIQVLAVRIDHVAQLRARHTPARMADLTAAIAAAAQDGLNRHEIMMGFDPDTDLLVVLPATAAVDLPHLEACVAQSIKAFDPDAATSASPADETWWDVSVGHPVSPRGAKTGRAARTISRALEAADDRALLKQARVVVGLTNASGR